MQVRQVEYNIYAMKYIIYKTTNLINNNIYIGQHATEDINDNYLGSGVALLSDIKKYGKDNFKKEILYIFGTRQEADKKERELVNANFIKRTDTYNIIEGGMYNSASSKLGTKALLEKIENEDFKKEWTSNISKGLRKYYKENDVWNKNTKGLLKKNKTSFKKGNIPWNKGIVGKDSHSHGRILTDTTRNKISESKKGIKNPMCTKVIRLKDLKIYNTMQECAIDNNISTRTIYAHCKKTLKNKNSEFMYYNDFVKESKNG